MVPGVVPRVLGVVPRVHGYPQTVPKHAAATQKHSLGRWCLPLSAPPPHVQGQFLYSFETRTLALTGQTTPKRIIQCPYWGAVGATVEALVGGKGWGQSLSPPLLSDHHHPLQSLGGTGPSTSSPWLCRCPTPPPSSYSPPQLPTPRSCAQSAPHGPSAWSMSCSLTTR